MKLSSEKEQALSIGVIALVLGIILGIAGYGLFHKCPEIPVIDNHLVDSLKIQNAIKEGKIMVRDSIIKANNKQQFTHDSVIINNHKALKNDYEKIKNLTPNSRATYIDSVLKRAGIRR